jgi:hypothetical protein
MPFHNALLGAPAPGIGSGIYKRFSLRFRKNSLSVLCQLSIAVLAPGSRAAGAPAAPPAGTAAGYVIINVIVSTSFCSLNPAGVPGIAPPAAYTFAT